MPTSPSPGPVSTESIPDKRLTGSSDNLFYPENLNYQGAFRLPEASGGSSWEYSGQALAIYPAGDPQGADDGFPGSLFAAGHDQQLMISEISIPRPVISKQVDDLNTAETLQPFADITGGLIHEGLSLPVMGLEIIEDRLYFCFGQHIQDFEASHGYSALNLSNPQPRGPWKLDGVSNYTSNDYLIRIPPSWAAQHTPGKTLATGRFREGVWSGYGPALYAIDPQSQGTLEATTLLLYGIQSPGEAVITSSPDMQMEGYQLADHWSGGAWISIPEKYSLILAGSKAMGRSWYGFANGVEWPYDCADTIPVSCPDVPDYPYENRGYWAEDVQAQIIFFKPQDLASVAAGTRMPYSPQPYAHLDLTPYLIDPHIDLARYKWELLGDMAYDEDNQLLYLIERLADGDKPVIHVWLVEKHQD